MTVDCTNHLTANKPFKKIDGEPLLQILFCFIDAQKHAATISVLLSNRAVSKFKIGDSKGCIEDATESLKLSPNAKALLRRATAYESLEK